MTRTFEVAELNKYISRLLSEDIILSNIKVSGEISNFNHHSSGHMYFSLKDNNSKIKAIMFKTYNEKMDLELYDGLEVVVEGYIDVYERDGQYQLYVKNVELSGIGELYLKYEKLKKQLEEEGLFDSFYKKKIPKYPNNIGIITSSTGAAVQDILNVLNRRYPIAKKYIYPTLVQGKDASREIIKALIIMDNYNLDTIILARGGGAIEDLFAFNDEDMARIIFAMKTPIITGIGHEIDFTIADFVSDLRAPTPSAAAEIATPDIESLKNTLNENIGEIISITKDKIKSENKNTDRVKRELDFLNPQSIVNDSYQSLDYLMDRIIRNNRIKDEYNRLAILEQKILSLDSNKALERGYSILLNEERKIVKSVTEIDEKNEYYLKLNDGEVDFKFKKI